MKKRNQIISGLLAAAMVLPGLGLTGRSVSAQEPAEEKQYIIVAEDAATYHQVAEEVSEDITVETPILAENNVIVAELGRKRQKNWPMRRTW